MITPHQREQGEINKRLFVAIACLVLCLEIFSSSIMLLSSLHSGSSRSTISTQSTTLTIPVQTQVSPTPTQTTTLSLGRGLSLTLSSSPTVSPRPTPTLTWFSPTPMPTPAPTAVQLPLSGFFNNKGIGHWPGQANFDGSGYSYPADQLPAGGLITMEGVGYQFPANGLQTNDNISAFNQAIPLPHGHYQQMFLLAAASWGPVTGTFTICYADGSTVSTPLTVLDWIAGSSNALQTSYRYGPWSGDGNRGYIYAIDITLDATRTTNTLILPAFLSGPYQNGQIHIFAVTLQP